jgi:hypothetical protein
MQNTLRLAITTGLAPGGSLRPQRMFELDNRGIRFLAPTKGHGSMTLDQFTELLRFWKTAREVWDIGLADILNYGKACFGEETMDALMEQLDFDLSDKMRAYAIGQIPLDMRSKGLTSEHLYVLGRIEDKSERGRWMALVDKHQLTPMELKKSIEVGQVVRQEQVDQVQGGQSGINTIQGVAHWFADWLRKTGGEQKIFAMSPERKRQLLEVLRGPGELYCKLKANLEGAAI